MECGRSACAHCREHLAAFVTREYPVRGGEQIGCASAFQHALDITGCGRGVAEVKDPDTSEFHEVCGVFNRVVSARWMREPQRLDGGHW